MDGIEVVALQSTSRTWEPHFPRLKQGPDEAQEECHTENHDED